MKKTTAGLTVNQLVDQANHPANGPLTVERIIRLIEVLQHSLQYQNGGDMSYVIADTIKGLDELLECRRKGEVLLTEKKFPHCQ